MVILLLKNLLAVLAIALAAVGCKPTVSDTEENSSHAATEDVQPHENADNGEE